MLTRVWQNCRFNAPEPHLLENGIDFRYIQELLAQTYRSPFDER